MENETLVDFEVDNLIQRMIKENVISEAKGYTEISSMLEEKKKRRRQLFMMIWIMVNCI